MRHILNIIILLTVCCESKATDTLTTKLINSIYLKVVDTSAKYYYLFESGYNPKLDTEDVKFDLINNQALAKEIPFKEFAAAITNDTAKINWQGYGLVKAKCIDKAHVPRYSHSVRMLKYVPFNTSDSTITNLQNQGIIPVPVKKGMSKKQLNIQRQKAIEQYDKHIPIEAKEFYQFSKPIFSNNGQYVLIELNKSERGCLYVFKLVEGKWTRIFQFKCWVS